MCSRTSTAYHRLFFVDPGPTSYVTSLSINLEMVHVRPISQFTYMEQDKTPQPSLQYPSLQPNSFHPNHKPNPNHVPTLLLYHHHFQTPLRPPFPSLLPHLAHLPPPPPNRPLRPPQSSPKLQPPNPHPNPRLHHPTPQRSRLDRSRRSPLPPVHTGRPPSRRSQRVQRAESAGALLGGAHAAVAGEPHGGGG